MGRRDRCEMDKTTCQELGAWWRDTADLVTDCTRGKGDRRSKHPDFSLLPLSDLLLVPPIDQTQPESRANPARIQRVRESAGVSIEVRLPGTQQPGERQGVHLEGQTEDVQHIA